jgi:hypothetical protein
MLRRKGEAGTFERRWVIEGGKDADYYSVMVPCAWLAVHTETADGTLNPCFSDQGVSSVPIIKQRHFLELTPLELHGLR